MRKLFENFILLISLFNFYFLQSCDSESAKNNHKTALNQAQSCKEGLAKQTDGSCQADETLASKVQESPIALLFASDFYDSPKPDCAPKERNEGMEDLTFQLLQQIQQEGLTEDRAVELALINNPALFAYYKNLDIGYAGLLEAGLRQNPAINVKAKYPLDETLQVNREFDTALSFLDNFLIPLREKAAIADIRVIESEVRQKVLDLAKEVQLTWLTIAILQEQLNLELKLFELQDLADQLRNLQIKAGNISALAARNKTITEEKVTGLKAEIEAAKEKMNLALGLFGSEICWQVKGKVDWKDDLSWPSQNMEMAALANRTDLEIIRREIEAIAQKAKLKEWWTYSNLKVGTSSERDTDGTIVSGPLIELEIPVFNYGQAEDKKNHALLEQAQNKLLGKAMQACSEVRQFFNTATFYQTLLKDLEDKRLPELAQHVVDGQAHYNVMTLGVYELLDLKDAEIQVTIEYLQALKSFKTAKIELLYAVGGSFDSLGEKQ